jgi:phosphatidylglycerophosphate synthase
MAEWDSISPEKRNAHQRVAAWSHGWLTVANGLTLAGGALTAKGLYSVHKGNYLRGAAEIAVGRGCDLLDGLAAERFGTRSKKGAALDAGVDKALGLAAGIVLTKAGVLSKEAATTMSIQQGQIVATNVAIEREGGEPNPSELGKRSTAIFWTSVLGRLVQKGLEETGHDDAAHMLGVAADAGESVSWEMGQESLQGYQLQLADLRQA